MLNARIVSSLKNPTYRLYYYGILCQTIPMGMQLMARALLMYRLTGSPSLLGIVALAHGLPWLLFTFLGGAIADRLQKKYVMVFGQAATTVTTLVIAISLKTGYLDASNEGSWWLLILTSAIQGMIMGLIMPSRQAIIPDLVEGDQLMNAIALNTLGINVLGLITPAITGFLIDSLDFSAAYFTMTGLNFLAIVFMLFLPRTPVRASAGNSHLGDIRNGISYIRGNKHILIVLGFSLTVILLSTPYISLTPIFTDDILKVGATGLGILLSVGGCGAIVGSLVLASIRNRRRGLLLISSSAVMGLALVGFSFSQNWNMSLAFMALVGFGQAVRMTLSHTLLQYYVEPEYRGRVMSIYSTHFGLNSIGAFGAGMLAAAVGVQWAVGGFAIVVVVISIAALLLLPRLRRLE